MEAGGQFQCPFGHSGILTSNVADEEAEEDAEVSMPFRAFGDSDLPISLARFCVRLTVSMPFRAFGDSDSADARRNRARRVAFQCPFGHSGILTLRA